MPADSPDIHGFDVSHINNGLPAEACCSIAEMIVAWSAYESALTDWMTVAFRMKADAARIMIGRMDTRSKIDKLKEIYKHREMSRYPSMLKKLKLKNETFSRVRNTVTHCKYVGYVEENGLSLIYYPNKFVTGSSRDLALTPIPLSRVNATTRFARRVTKTISEIVPIEQFR